MTPPRQLRMPLAAPSASTISTSRSCLSSCTRAPIDSIPELPLPAVSGQGANLRGNLRPVGAMRFAVFRSPWFKAWARTSMTVSTFRLRRRALRHERWFKPQFLVRTAQHILAAGLDLIKRRHGELALNGILSCNLFRNHGAAASLRARPIRRACGYRLCGINRQVSRICRRN